MSSFVTERLSLPNEAEQWLSKEAENRVFSLFVCWRDNWEIELGKFSVDPPMFCYEPDLERESPEKNLKGFLHDAKKKFLDFFGQALTRAGWIRPYLSPLTWDKLFKYRNTNEQYRLEFIFDTNGLCSGIGQWLAALFADICDLVVTDVTLREIQDNEAISEFSKSLSKCSNCIDKIKHRQMYLSACRFREFSGFQRLLWRELELDDTALLLSRGSRKSGADKEKKNSESDTLLLRSIRRSIRNRNKGLERFFVTSDTALARRALTELPEGSVITGQTRKLENGAIYYPKQWWPGENEGCALIHSTPMRLLWELLAISDYLKLKTESNEYRFQAFKNPMWLEDYTSPWIDVELISETHSSGSLVDLTDNRPSLETRLYPEKYDFKTTELNANLRIGASTLFDLLSVVVRSDNERDVDLPREFNRMKTDSQKEYVKFLEGIGLVRLNVEKAKFESLSNFDLFKKSWLDGDLEAIASLFRNYTVIKEILDTKLESSPRRPKGTIESTRSILSMLGQIIKLDNDYYIGAANPSCEEVQQKIFSFAKDKGFDNTIPVYILFVEVFLKDLKVTPYRARMAWDRMLAAGVFETMEFRKGGSSTGKKYQEVYETGPFGYMKKKYDLESYKGNRDLKVVHV